MSILQICQICVCQFSTLASFKRMLLKCPIFSLMTQTKLLGTLRFATTDGWTGVARCLGDWIDYGALWRVVARKLKLSCYTNYVLREIAAVEFTLKMSFQKVRDELIYCFANGILDEEEFILLYDAYKSTNSIYPDLQAPFEIQ